MSQLRHIVRKLALSPLFTVVTVLTLAIGIGANTAVFSVVNGVLIRPLPFDEPDSLVGIWYSAPGLGWDQVNEAPSLYLTYREESRVFESNGMWSFTRASITGLQEPEQVVGLRVTDSVFPVLRVQPYLGRLFTPEDDSPGTPETVVLSHRYWLERFAGDPGAVGRTVDVDGVSREIIGVTGADLDFLDTDPAIFLPYRLDIAEVFFGNFSHRGIARLAPGATVAQANDEIPRMIEIALDRFPLPAGFSRGMLDEAGFAPFVRPLKQDVVGNVGSTLWILLGTVGMVLLVACANVANLFLVRAEARTQELAIRSALGASRGQVARQLMGESVVLGLLGGVAGLGLAWAGLRLLLQLSPRGLPRLAEIGIDPTVLAFTLGISVLAGILFGLVPVLRIGSAHLVMALKEGGRGGTAGRDRHRARNALVVAQVAMALVLLIGSGLMIRSFQALRSVDPGFRDPASVLTLGLTIPPAEIEEPPAVARAFEALQAELLAIAGVESVGMSTSITMDGNVSMDPIFVEEFPTDGEGIPPLRRFKWITPGFLETMGSPLVAGRLYSWSDVHEAARVAIVTENLAGVYWSNPADALGKRVRPYPDSAWREIVGVVGNILDDGPSQPAVPTVYWPTMQEGFFGEQSEMSATRSMAFAIRSPRVGQPGLLDEVRAAIWSQNASLPLANVRTLEQVFERSMARTSFTLTMLAIAAGAAMLLGGIGIYGVTSYIVAQRTREIGVRMALGAQQREVGNLVLRHGLLLAGIGVLVGFVAAAGLTRLMAALLFGVSAVDPVTYAAVGAGVVVVALVACYVPARRASRIDPIEALRWE